MCLRVPSRPCLRRGGRGEGCGALPGFGAAAMSFRVEGTAEGEVDVRGGEGWR